MENIIVQNTIFKKEKNMDDENIEKKEQEIINNASDKEIDSGLEDPKNLENEAKQEISEEKINAAGESLNGIGNKVAGIESAILKIEQKLSSYDKFFDKILGKTITEENKKEQTPKPKMKNSYLESED